MSKPRIYIAISTFHPLVGGAETQALAQARILRERGHEATIITFQHDKAWPVRETLDEVPVLRVAGTFLNRREKLPRALQQVLYLLALMTMGYSIWRRQRRFDLLHVYQLSSLALPTALACWLARKPILIAVRSTGSKGEFSAQNNPKLLAGHLDPATPWLNLDHVTWSNGDLEGLTRLGQPAVRFTRWLLRHTHSKIIILSTSMKQYLATNNFLLPGTILIPNGVNIERFRPADDATFAQRAQTVVCVAKLRYEKGIDALLQAWYLVQQECPQARLILVGSSSRGSDPVQDKLLQLATTLSLNASIDFVGLQKDIPAQLHRGAIAVLSSRWEGMPNAVLEAMACGLPCVATRVSGSEDIIADGVNGLLVDIEDYRGLASALLTLLQNSEKVRQYGEAARQTVEQRYAFDHITDTYMDLYYKMTQYEAQEKALYITV